MSTFERGTDPQTQLSLTCEQTPISVHWHSPNSGMGQGSQPVHGSPMRGHSGCCQPHSPAVSRAHVCETWTSAQGSVEFGVVDAGTVRVFAVQNVAIEEVQTAHGRRVVALPNMGHGTGF